MPKIKSTPITGTDNDFGKRLRSVRKSLQLNQKEFAKGIKCSLTSLSDIETGKSKPCHDFFYNIVNTYHVNLYYLLFGQGNMFTTPDRDVLIEGNQIKTGDEEVDEFLFYFFNSRLVHRYIMFNFHKFFIDSRESIKKDLENSEGE
jgi:transcriptional regulator with XRE-family HTH domain